MKANQTDLKLIFMKWVFGHYLFVDLACDGNMCICFPKTCMSDMFVRGPPEKWGSKGEGGRGRIAGAQTGSIGFSQQVNTTEKFCEYT